MGAAEQQTIELGPQAGPQTDFLSSLADVAIYGGAAGGGKSYGLLLEPVRHYDNGLFGGVIFRRNGVDIRNEGALWDESEKIYGALRGHSREAFMEWVFPSGMRMKFAHLEYEKTVLNWQGAQIPYIGFDELTHFTKSQFFYMMSRNRSTSGVPGYIRATCNPDCDSWVREFIAWWINPDTGFPIPERSGVLRWFIRQDDLIVWADSREELIAEYGDEQKPKSVTFIPSKVQDNKILMEKDPSYLSNLMALSRVDRMRLKDGNWNVRPSAGMFFQRGWFDVIEVMPAGVVRTIRYWDRAATKPSETNSDPDYTVGVKLHKMKDGTWIIEHAVSMRDSPLEVEKTVKSTASQDGRRVTIGIEQDPGSAGVADRDNYLKLLAGFHVVVNKPTNDKITRAKAASAQAEARNFKVMRGAWNEEFFTQLENFPDALHDDHVDALSGAFNQLCTNPSMFDAL